MQDLGKLTSHDLRTGWSFFSKTSCARYRADSLKLPAQYAINVNELTTVYFVFPAMLELSNDQPKNVGIV